MAYTMQPWLVCSSFLVVDKDGRIIANCRPFEEIKELKVDFWEAIGNTHLIAAAPDLLEACKYAFECMVALGASPSGLLKIGEVIAKAEGKE